MTKTDSFKGSVLFLMTAATGLSAGCHTYKQLFISGVYNLLILNSLQRLLKPIFRLYLHCGYAGETSCFTPKITIKLTFFILLQWAFSRPETSVFGKEKHTGRIGFGPGTPEKYDRPPYATSGLSMNRRHAEATRRNTNRVAVEKLRT